MKVIAYFLPQFHEIEENNRWWGKGFTEWTNVRRTRQYYKGIKPLKPLNENYYNLLSKETLVWQAELANHYGVYGFCYYHYWFEGRKILEKPAELLLENKDINQKFCFCWANHTWRKTWNGSKEILIEQTYGDKDEWEEHFLYLLTFFKDERYIKKDNKPIFMIYDCQSVKFLEERISFYNIKCRENGFDGIYVIESINSINSFPVATNSSAVTLREPSVAISMSSPLKKIIRKLKTHRKNKFMKPFLYDYKDILEKSICAMSNYKVDKDIILGSFTGWDSTPRHKNRGYIIKNNNPELFHYYLNKQKEYIKKKNLIDYIFVNAWNEWAEGMILEPDELNKYGYLEAIKKL